MVDFYTRESTIILISDLVNIICVHKRIFFVPKNTDVIFLNCSLCIHIEISDIIGNFGMIF